MLATLIASGAASTAFAEKKAGFGFDPTGGVLREEISGATTAIEGRFAPMAINGASGLAWRTDGYTSRAVAQLGNIVDGNAASIRLVLALDTYTIIDHEKGEISDNNVQTEIVSCLNEGAKTGFGFFAGRTGRYQFRAYVGGNLVTVNAQGILPLWEWTDLTAIINGNAVNLYANGSLVGSAIAQGSGIKINGPLYIGRAGNSNQLGGANLATFNGAFDTLEIYNNAFASAASSKSYADLNLPANRYENDRLRARFHGQPGQNWTNETHGLVYNAADGKWHAFFQRTGSAPIMSHQHWGHITSADLMTWRDEKPALAPSESYDIKGCWSGCVFTDPEFNGGKPTILYTGVDWTQPYAAMATATDATTLRDWTKAPVNPLVKLANPESDPHFRDTYYFRQGGQAYMMIGSDNAVQLYKYNGSAWVRDGNFYNAQDGVDKGFTEMPNVTFFPSANKWVMTTSPLSGPWGTTCLYRIGDVVNGKLANYSAAQKVDLFGHDGYGLLSPSVGTDKNGQIVALGIVPDKMPTHVNVDLGYAHLYSLPRAWSIGADGTLWQKPYESVYALRDKSRSTTMTGEEINGAVSLHPVRGRMAEVTATFTVGDAPFGFNFYKNAKGKAATLSYNPSNKELKIDFAGIARLVDDMGFGQFSATLPVAPAKGEDFKLQLFIDHTIVDIFVNDRYASSVRIYPTDENADLIEVFSNGPTTVKSLEAYILGQGDTSATPVTPPTYELPKNSGKIAFLKSASSLSDQEQAALAFYTSSFKNAPVITTSETSRIKASDIECLWIHVDRMNIAQGWANLPSEFTSDALVGALKQFVADGGNLYLTGHATQLAVAIGRIGEKYTPNQFYAGDGGDGNDEWTVNPIIMGQYNHTSHPLYNELEVSDAYPYETYGLLYGGGATIRRIDHNCMWNLGQIALTTDGANRIEKFENATGASVIGTWGQDKSDEFAGIVEFFPTAKGAGTVLANGLAACQWAVNGGNADEWNLKLLTANAFAYLTGDNAGGTVVNPEPEPEPEKPEVPETSGKVAMFVGYADYASLSANRQEKAAVDYFTSTFPKGKVIYAGQESQIKAASFDMVWVNADRLGIAQGWRNLPAEFTSSALVDALTQFLADGGNIFLSKHAVQLVNAIGRTAHEPTEFNSGDGGSNGDAWQTNVHSNGIDHSTHPIFSGMNVDNVDYGKLVTLMSGNFHREDHNCMWKLNDFGGHDSFCSANNAKVLGTWGHNGGQAWAGIVEFLPAPSAAKAISKEKAEARKGTVIANGLAAYEWAPRSGENLSQGAIGQLTSNIVGYLSPKIDETNVVDIVSDDDCDAEPVYYNLQGVRIENPAQGIYIKVIGSKATKVVL